MLSKNQTVASSYNQYKMASGPVKNMNLGQNKGYLPAPAQNMHQMRNLTATLAAKEIGPSDFQSEVIEASKTQPVVVNFNSTWGRPCKIMKDFVTARSMVDES